MDWEGIWTSIKDFFTNNIWNIVTFIAVLFIGIIVIKVTLNLFKKFMSKTKVEKVTQGFLFHIIKFALYLTLLLILLNIIGVSITGLLTTISAMVLAVGLALQNLITNVANGIVIVSTHMFKKGDYVVLGGVEGSIDDINFLFTRLITVDNKRITIPNSTILNNPVTNFGANATRRIDLYFEVAYESDVETVKNIVIEVMKSNGKVRLDPAPFCRLKSLEASSIKFFANCWVDNEDYWDVYYYVMENVFNEFKRNNISIPYNQLEIRERQDNVVMPVIKKKLPNREEKVRKGKKNLDLENDDLFAIFSRKNSSGKTNKTDKSKQKTKGQEKSKNKEQKPKNKEQKIKEPKDVKINKKQNKVN